MHMPDSDPPCVCAQAGDRLAAVAGWRWGGESLVEYGSREQKSKWLRTRPQKQGGGGWQGCV